MHSLVIQSAGIKPYGFFGAFGNLGRLVGIALWTRCPRHSLYQRNKHDSGRPRTMTR